MGLFSRFRKVKPPSQPEPPAKRVLEDLSEEQVAKLSIVMESRFTGFISNSIYHFGRIPVADRGEFLRFEIGLLLGLLNSGLDSPELAEKYWHRIVVPLVYKYIPRVETAGMKHLTDTARIYSEVWVKHEREDDGPLSAILEPVINLAFGIENEQ